MNLEYKKQQTMYNLFLHVKTLVEKFDQRFYTLQINKQGTAHLFTL